MFGAFPDMRAIEQDLFADGDKIVTRLILQGTHRDATDATLRTRATALEEKIRAEDGVERAIEIIEHHAQFLLFPCSSNRTDRR